MPDIRFVFASCDPASLDEARSELDHVRLEDIDGFIVVDGHLRAFMTLIEHGYKIDRSEPYIRLLAPT